MIRLHVNTDDMGGDQLVVVERVRALGFRFVVWFPCEMFADRAEDQLFDFGGGHTVELRGLVRLPLNED